MNKAKQLLQTHWKTILIVVAGIWLLSILFSKCNENKELLKERDADKKEILATKKALDESQAKFTKDSTERTKEVNRLDTVIMEQRAQLEAKQTDLKKQGALVRRLLKDASGAPLDLSDSINRIVNRQIDSALNEFDALSLRYAALEYNMTELITAGAQRDSVLNLQLQATYTELAAVRKAYANLFSKYQVLFADVQKLAKKHKRSKALTKILAAIAIAEGAGLLLK